MGQNTLHARRGRNQFFGRDAMFLLFQHEAVTPKTEHPDTCEHRNYCFENCIFPLIPHKLLVGKTLYRRGSGVRGPRKKASFGSAQLCQLETPPLEIALTSRVMEMVIVLIITSKIM